MWFNEDIKAKKYQFLKQIKLLKIKNGNEYLNRKLPALSVESW